VTLEEDAGELVEGLLDPGAFLGARTHRGEGQ
jgi:hypothetical protein